MARSEPLRIGVLASGRGSNLQAIIDAIEAGKLDCRLAIVISDRADAQALERALKHGVKGVFVDPKAYPSREAFDQVVLAVLAEHRVELVCLAGYMRILSPAFVRALPGQIMNIHPALLPSFPGLHPQRQALEHGVKVSGATVHFVDEGVDTGPIICQAAVPVREGDTEETLAARILAEEHQLYPRAIRLIAEGRLEVQDRRVHISGQGSLDGGANMSEETDRLLSVILRLPPEARAALAGHLIESLDREVEEGAEAAWSAEIARRMKELEGGKVRPVPWAEARRQIMRPGSESSGT